MNRFIVFWTSLFLLSGIAQGARLSMEDVEKDKEGGGRAVSKSDFLQHYEERERTKKARQKNKPAAAPVASTATELEVPEWVNNGNAIFKAVPTEIILNKKYVFVIPPLSDNISNDAYNEILKKIASQGYIVISNPLDSKSDFSATTEKIKGDIGFLLNGNVPHHNIAVIGIGNAAGVVAFRLAAKINNQEVNYILISAIPKKSQDSVLSAEEKIISGRFLSIYDKEDQNSGSCKEFFKYIKENVKGARSLNEVRLKTGNADKMPTEALDAWINPALLWLK